MHEEFEILNGLSKEEIDTLNKFKELPITKNIKDHHLLIFLFSKKFNLKNAELLLTNNLNVREKLGISMPVVKSQVNEELAKKASSFNIIGYHDKQGRSISYLHPSKLVPKEFTFVEYMTFLFWSQDQSVNQSSSAHRNGMVIIEDLDKISLFKHFDQRLNEFLKKNKIPDIQNVFVGRIQKIYILNAPWLLKPLLSFAKVFVKSKLLKRIEFIKTKEHHIEILEFDIDKSQYLSEYGGSLNITYSEYFDSLPSNF